MSAKEPNTQALTILRRKQVEARTGLCKSAIYAKCTPNPKRPGDFDPTFPAPIILGPKTTGWLAHEIENWILEQVNKSRESRVKGKTKLKSPEQPSQV